MSEQTAGDIFRAVTTVCGAAILIVATAVLVFYLASYGYDEWRERQ